jgi:hypothetical protein
MLNCFIIYTLHHVLLAQSDPPSGLKCKCTCTPDGYLLYCIVSHPRKPKNQFYVEGYIGALISLWLFLFAAQAKEFFLDGLKKLEQRTHKCVELRGNM